MKPPTLLRAASTFVLVLSFAVATLAMVGQHHALAIAAVLTCMLGTYYRGKVDGADALYRVLAREDE